MGVMERRERMKGQTQGGVFHHSNTTQQPETSVGGRGGRGRGVGWKMMRGEREGERWQGSKEADDER